MADDDRPDEVGYGKPPRSTQFQKGTSGNPRGRPKGSKSLATIVMAESRKPVRVSGSNCVRTVTKAEAAVIQMSNKAVQGDPRSTRHFLGLIQTSESALAAGNGSVEPNKLDQESLEIFRRMLNQVEPERQKE